MKHLILPALVVAAVLASPFRSHAADTDARKAKAKEAMLKRYDKNGDGKLDESEREAMRADLKKKAKGKSKAE